MSTVIQHFSLEKSLVKIDDKSKTDCTIFKASVPSVTLTMANVPYQGYME